MQDYVWSFYISRLSLRRIVTIRMISPSQSRGLTTYHAKRKLLTTYDANIKMRWKRNSLSNCRKEVKLEAVKFYNCKSLQGQMVTVVSLTNIFLKLSIDVFILKPRPIWANLFHLLHHPISCYNTKAATVIPSLNSEPECLSLYSPQILWNWTCLSTMQMINDVPDTHQMEPQNPEMHIEMLKRK